MEINYVISAYKEKLTHEIDDMDMQEVNTEFALLRVEDNEWIKSIPEKGMCYQELVKAIKKG